MWIKSVSSTWINMNHVTHFDIDPIPGTQSYIVQAFLSTSKSVNTTSSRQDQVFVVVYQGTTKKCRKYIKRKLRWQAISQWVGYLVAGGVGAVLTFLFSRLAP